VTWAERNWFACSDAMVTVWTRQTGSHVRLTSVARGHEHHCTVPLHKPLRVGTLGSVLKDVASYLEMDRSSLLSELFE
jgi:hypothetical protein